MSEIRADRHESNRMFYNRISRAYDLIADANEHTAREAGERALGLKEGEQVLEIGFGTGNSAINLAQFVGASGKVFGIDISEGMREVAQEKIEQKGLADRVELTVGDARKLPYPDGTFDAAFTSFTLELFPLEEIPAVLAEVQRVLRGGGRFGVVSMATVKEGERASTLEEVYIWMHRHFPHIVDCQPIDAEKFLREAGFEIIQREDLAIWTMPVTAMVGRK